MVVLVTGGSGFIGSNLVDQLLQRGFQVRVFDLHRPLTERVEWFKGDLLNNNDLLHACKDAEVVYHLAAIADVNVVIPKTGLCIRVNEVGTTNLLQACVAREVERFILASTTWVYGDANEPVTEDSSIPLPEHLYTKTKIGQEQLVYTWNKHFGLPYTILRYGIPYGPRMRENMVISIFTRKAIKKEPITVFGDGGQGRCFIYVEDLAEGNLAALKAEAKNQIFNLAGSEFVTIKDIVEYLGKLFENLDVSFKPSRRNDFKGVKVSIEKAKQHLSWTPKTSFPDGLQKYVELMK